MTCPYCGAKGSYIIQCDDETYYCFECGNKFKY